MLEDSEDIKAGDLVLVAGTKANQYAIGIVYEELGPVGAFNWNLYRIFAEGKRRQCTSGGIYKKITTATITGEYYGYDH
tara:strand:- start:623 stop:859 length:237 start_codon:yes stop_codon:yes gene_type:complete